MRSPPECCQIEHGLRQHTPHLTFEDLEPEDAVASRASVLDRGWIQGAQERGLAAAEDAAAQPGAGGAALSGLVGGAAPVVRSLSFDERVQPRRGVVV